MLYAEALAALNALCCVRYDKHKQLGHSVYGVIGVGNAVSESLSCIAYNKCVIKSKCI